MEYYDLLGREHVVGTIDPAILGEFELKKLLLKFFPEKQAGNMLQILTQILSATGIKNRQELFVELQTKQIEEYFFDLRKLLYDIRAIHKTYSLHKNIQYKEIYYVDVMLKYSEIVAHICDRNVLETTNSTILKSFIESFLEIQASDEFCQLKAEADSLKAELRAVKSVELAIDTPNGSPTTATFKKEENQTNIADELWTIAQNLEEVGDELRRSRFSSELSSSFIDGLAQIYPELFVKIGEFHNNYKHVFSFKMVDYIGQISFLLNMNQLFLTLKQHDIPLTMAEVATEKQVTIHDAYDISLLLKMKSGIVPNDVEFNEEAGFLILTGANSGGKTSYLRTVGISQILFLAGSYIPAEAGKIYPFRKILTQFPADEGKANMGRLHEEQRVVAELVDNADENSLVILNETFSSTNEEISLKLSYELLENLCKAGAYGIFVTHQHQLLDQGKDIKGKTKVGYLSVVVLADDNNTRTYKIVSRKSDAQSYAKSIIEKHGLSRENLLKKLVEVE